MLIDYGYTNQKMKNTLQGVSNHKFANILEHLFKIDITHNINFDLFKNFIKKIAGLDNIFTTQKYFLKNPKIGDKVVFLDQAHYTLVKTNFFNGINHPEIVLWNSDNNDFKVIKSFDFKDFEMRN